MADYPDDLQAKFDLAGVLAADGDLAGASDHLLAILAADRDWNGGGGQGAAFDRVRGGGRGVGRGAHRSSPAVLLAVRVTP